MTNTNDSGELDIYDNGDEFDENESSKLHSLFLPIAYSIICIFGLIGNLLILVIFIFYEKVKTLTDIFLVNLATADILFLCTFPFLAYQSAKSWIFGEVMCRIIRGAYRINLFTSMLTLTCITFDRFISITQATKLNHVQLYKHKWGGGICTAVWILSVFLAIPQFKHSTTGPFNNICNEIYDNSVIEVLVTSIQMAVGFYVPLIAMLICYTFIINTLINASSFQKPKSFKIIVTLVVVFIATQLPFNVVILLYTLGTKFRTQTSFVKALIISEVIAYLHACLNPILYFFVGIKFRKNFWKILKDLGLVKHFNERTNNLKTTEADSKNISASTNVEAICMNQT
ncbi:C-X-C chemokine receptor type 6-like [Pelobates fuscus]|uniref:C-X-C chemokine receptor type 6-like n=1 Tax=Pelobates fuscus TaxID=191477 RepID=UPI002FE440A2